MFNIEEIRKVTLEAKIERDYKNLMTIKENHIKELEIIKKSILDLADLGKDSAIFGKLFLSIKAEKEEKEVDLTSIAFFLQQNGFETAILKDTDLGGDKKQELSFLKVSW